MEKTLLKNQLCFKLYALSRQITTLYRPLLEELALTYPQYLVILVLGEASCVSVKELGEALYLDSGTLTPLLKRLEQKGLIARQRNQEDERQVLITLTDAGQQKHAQAQCLSGKLAQETRLPEPQYASLHETIDEMLTRLRHPTS